MTASMVSLLVVLSWAVPSARAENVVAGDLARLQGQWIAKAGPKKGLLVDLRIDGSTAKVKVTTHQGLSIQAEGEIRIDTNASPKALDWVNFTTLDDERIPEMLAIYELVGETFRVCNAGPNNARPSQFKPGEGVLADLVVFERKPTAADAKSTERVGPIPTAAVR